MRLVPLALIVLVATGASSASGTRAAAVTKDQLAIMVLPKADLGVPRRFQAAIGSGFQANAAEVDDTLDPKDTPAALRGAGRVIGYQLTYGDVGLTPLTKKKGLIDLDTEVELFKSPAAADRYIAKQLADGRRLRGKYAQSGIHLDAFTTFPAPRVGKHATGARATGRFGNVRFFGTEVLFRSGPIVATVSIDRADGKPATAQALKLARKLARRIAQVEAGKLKERPAPVPRTARKGQPPRGGPPLAPMELAAADLPGGTQISREAYVADDDSIGSYERVFLAPIQLGKSVVLSLESDLSLFRTDREAAGQFFTFQALYSSDAVKRAYMEELGNPGVLELEVQKPLSVGDDAYAIAIRTTLNGQNIRFVQFAVRVGRVIGLVNVGGLASSFRYADVQPLAGKLAKRIAAGL